VYSELKIFVGVGKNVQKLYILNPKLIDLIMDRLRRNPKGRTRGCCKSLGRSVVRGERPVKISDSWFSAKIILVTSFLILPKVK